jgi:hypothetical protein
MKLRFRKNTLRLRVNQQEVQQLAAGKAIEEVVHFPGHSSLAYSLASSRTSEPEASMLGSTIRISAPALDVKRWASSDDIGLYFELPADGSRLQVAIEKDLECLDGPPEERDPHAYRRKAEGPCN